MNEADWKLINFLRKHNLIEEYDYLFNNNLPKELIPENTLEIAKKELNEIKKICDNGQGSLDNFSLIFKNEKVIRKVDQPCMATFRFFKENGKITDLEYIVTHPKMGQYSKNRIVYIDWLINRSPWASLYISKDAEDVYKNGAIIKPFGNASFIVSGMIPLRHCHELIRQIDNFCFLREYIKNENMAYIAALFLWVKDKEVYQSKYPSSAYQGHLAFNWKELKEEGLNRFIRGTVEEYQRDVVPVNWEYSPLCNSFQDDRNYRNLKEPKFSFNSVKKKFKDPDVWGEPEMSSVIPLEYLNQCAIKAIEEVVGDCI